MPWFKIDDSSHSHPKFVRAGNAALGLWLRCGAYSAQHLTEGVIPAEIVKAYGTGPQAAKLVKVGLWHEHGHTCARCAQPPSGDYIVHDFFEAGRNTTRAQHEANKKAAADRAAKSRESKKAKGTARDSNVNRERIDDETNVNRDRFAPQFPGSAAGQDGLSQRTPADSAADTHAAAMPYPSTSYGSTAAAGEAASEPDLIPGDSLADLKRAIAAAGLSSVSWTMRTAQHERARRTLERVGLTAMVGFAVHSARLKGAPASASAWLDGWEGLQSAPPPGTALELPAAVGDNVVRLPTGPRLTGTDANAAAHWQLIQQLRDEEGL